ncbi:MAG TPA: hypothetical protein VLA24_09440 [Pseudomonadales bacterium]|nr:hypothetical protein [Pseudomonadales bacterium]
MDTANRLYRFTSSTGRVNHGIVTEFVGNGVYVLFDSFDVKERITLPARYAYTSLTPNPYADNAAAKRELLPLTGTQPWHDSQVATVAAILVAGRFGEWWPVHGTELMAAMYKRSKYK